MKIAVTFGAMAEPLHRQLRCSASLMRPFQADADAITRLTVRGLLTETQAHSARRKLMRRIMRVLPAPSRKEGKGDTDA